MPLCPFYVLAAFLNLLFFNYSYKRQSLLTSSACFTFLFPPVKPSLARWRVDYIHTGVPPPLQALVPLWMSRLRQLLLPAV